METSSVRDDVYERWHKKNLKVFLEMSKKIKWGLWKIISIQVDEPEFGHRRVVIMIHDERE